MLIHIADLHEFAGHSGYKAYDDQRFCSTLQKFDGNISLVDGAVVNEPRSGRRDVT